MRPGVGSGGPAGTPRLMRESRHGEVTAVHFATARSRLVGYGVYVFVIRRTLIDTGFHGVRRQLRSLLEDRRPDGVLLTHQHEDHAGNAEIVAQRGIPMGASVETLAAIRAVAPIGFYRRFVWSSMPPLRTPIADHAPQGLALIHAPGHSSDHHVIWDADHGVLFSGDLFLGVKVRVARPGEDPRLLVRSLRMAAALQPAMMLDSHRGRIDSPVAALHAKADWMDETITEIDRLINAGWPDRRIRDAVLGREAVVGYISAGELSKLNFVRAVRASR